MLVPFSFLVNQKAFNNIKIDMFRALWNTFFFCFKISGFHLNNQKAFLINWIHKHKLVIKNISINWRHKTMHLLIIWNKIKIVKQSAAQYFIIPYIFIISVY